MQAVRASLGAVRSFFSRHPRLRVSAIVLAVLLALLLLLHPRGVKTYLILGMDNYGSLDETGRSDVMMLVQLDFSRVKVSTVTFTRDLFLDDERGEPIKLNAVVRSRDENALVSMLSSAFGVKIDGWFRVNFTTVIELVDALGGAQIELTAEEARYINREAGVYGNPLSEGLNRLAGGQALAYARCRKLDNDIGRGKRQNKLIAAMVQGTKSMTLAKLGGVYQAMKHAWRSSLSAPRQAKLFLSALWLRGAQTDSIGVPFDGCWRYGNSSKGESGVLIDLEANRALLHEALGR